MEEKIVSLYDMWSQVDGDEEEMTSLRNFGIYDDQNKLHGVLHREVFFHHEDHENKQYILDTLEENFKRVSDARAYFSNILERKIEEIKIRHHLTRMIEHGGNVYQFLMTDITNTLNDGNVRWKIAPTLCFQVNQEFSKWNQIVLLDEHSEGFRDLLERMREQHRTKTPTQSSGPVTNHVGSSE